MHAACCGYFLIPAAGLYQHQKCMFAAMYRSDKQIRIAILDLYEGQANEGMRCIREILQQYSRDHQLELIWDEFEVRKLQQIP